MKQALKDIMLSRAFEPWLNLGDTSVGSVLMLHRVSELNPEGLRYNEHLKVSPAFLESLIGRFKKNGYTFVSIDELYDVLVKKKSAKKLVVITLDDGYEDNYKIAFPIFKQHTVPFTVYVSTSLPEKQMIYWWYLLEDLVLQNDQLVLGTNEVFRCSTMTEKEQSFLAIRQKIIAMNPFYYRETLPRLFSNYNFDTNKYNDTLPLSWEELKLLSNDSLATIGNHTHAHVAMKYSSTDEAIKDIEYSNALFEQKLGSKPSHFCYPYGDSFSLSEKDTALISRMGFKTAVTTDAGNIYPAHGENLFKLPRIFVSEFGDSDLIKDLRLMKLKRK